MRLAKCLAEGLIPAVMAYSLSPAPNVVWKTVDPTPVSYGHNLYANLRILDNAGVDLIIVEAPPMQSEWAAINDRLHRSISGSGL